MNWGELMDENRELNLFYDYTETVTKRILSNKKKDEVRDELFSHLLEEYDRSIALGLDDEEAQEKAISIMGDKYDLAVQFGALYPVSPALYMNSSLNCLMWGTVLISFTLNLFVGFAAITKFIGIIVLLLGLFKLKDANRRLNKAFALYILKLAFMLVVEIISMTLTDATDFTLYMGIASTLLNVVIYGYIFAGLYSLCSLIDAEGERTDMLKGFIGYFFFSIFCIGGILYSELTIILFVLTIMCLIVTVRQLGKAKKVLTDFNNELELNKFLSEFEKVVYVIFVLVIALVPVISMFAISCAKPETVIYEPMNDEIQQAEVVLAKENLLQLGLPEKILKDLPDSEIVKYKDATYLEAVEETEINYNKSFGGETPFFTEQKFIFYFKDGYIRVLLCLEFSDSNIAKFRQGIYMRFYSDNIISDNSKEDFYLALCEIDGKTIESKVISEYYHDFDWNAAGFEFKFDNSSVKKRVYLAKTYAVSYYTSSYVFALDCRYIYEKIPLTANWKSMNTIAYEELYGGISFGADLNSVKSYQLYSTFRYDPEYWGYEAIDENSTNENTEQ